MGQYLSNSQVFRVIDGLSNYLKASNTYKVLCIILNWCRNSAINQLIVRYLARNSSLQQSVTLKKCSKVFSFFDKLWDKLYCFGVRCGKSSSLISFIRDSFCNENSFEAFGLIVLFFSLGFGVTTLLLGTFNVITAALAGIGILVALLLFLGKARWTVCLKSSIFWRFALYIFD